LTIIAALVKYDKSAFTLKFAQLDNSFIYWQGNSTKYRKFYPARCSITLFYRK